ncbi:HAD family hydrolase [Anaerobacillus sp. MEB173]|uniref:HAD family hydrolase n=1 Tax=Anaerobacillus sp. MEB173 TaxID=3383345 RepID=UPI003F92621F
MKLAIFDFDGTLFPEETFKILMNHLKKHDRYKTKYKHFILRIVPIYIAYKLKLYPEQKMKEKSMQEFLSAFHQVTELEVRQFFSEVSSVMAGKYNHSVLDAIEKHRLKGDHLILVSGAFLPLLEEINKDLHFDSIIGTDIQSSNCVINRRNPINHIQGERKKQRLYEYFSNENIDWRNSTAYGDSYSDLSILNLVGHPVAVQPDPRLRREAVKRKWKIIE